MFYFFIRVLRNLLLKLHGFMCQTSAFNMVGIKSDRKKQVQFHVMCNIQGSRYFSVGSRVHRLDILSWCRAGVSCNCVHCAFHACFNVFL